MTVGELMAKLAAFGSDTEVILMTDDSYYGATDHNIGEVAIENGKVVLMDRCNTGLSGSCDAVTQQHGEDWPKNEFDGNDTVED